MVRLRARDRTHGKCHEPCAGPRQRRRADWPGRRGPRWPGVQRTHSALPDRSSSAPMASRPGRIRVPSR
jgi:hypothetical protein